MWIAITVAAAAVALLALIQVRAHLRCESVRNPDTGQPWTPRCLYVAYDCLIAPGEDPQGRPADAHLARMWKALAVVAGTCRAASLETPSVGHSMKCNRCRMYDLRGLRRRDRWVLYTLAAEFVDACRDAGVRACASIAGDAAESVSAFLRHAHIPEIAQRDEIFRDLVRDGAIAEQRLEGFRWLLDKAREAA
jgi:hypothetical protein